MLISTSTSNEGPSYVVSAKLGKASQSTWKEIKIEAPFSRWFSADGYFVAKPFQHFLAGGIPVVGEADPKNAVEEIVRDEKPTAVPLGSNLNVNIKSNFQEFKRCIWLGEKHCLFLYSIWNVFII